STVAATVDGATRMTRIRPRRKLRRVAGLGILRDGDGCPAPARDARPSARVDFTADGALPRPASLSVDHVDARDPFDWHPVPRSILPPDQDRLHARAGKGSRKAMIRVHGQNG